MVRNFFGPAGRFSPVEANEENGESLGLKPRLGARDTLRWKWVPLYGHELTEERTRSRPIWKGHQMGQGDFIVART